MLSTLDALERYARAFDAISREQDAHYSARSFVRWVRLETTTPSYGERGIGVETPDEALVSSR